MARTLSRRLGLLAVAVVVAVVIAAVLAGLAVLSLPSWLGSAAGKQWAEQRLSNALDRRVSIGGNLSLQWQPSRTAGRWLPVPMVEASNVTIANPPWATGDNFGSAGHLRLQISLPPLLQRQLVFERIDLADARLHLERNANGESNWEFGAAGGESGGWQIRLESMGLGPTRLRYTDTGIALDLEAELTRARADDSDDATAFTLQGHYRDARLRGEGTGGTLLSLTDSDVTYPLTVALHSGPVSLAASGHVGNLYEDPTVDLQVEASGPSMALLYPLTGLVLPRTAPFHTSGRLQGTLGAEQAAWHYQGFTGTMGDSDIGGDLSYQSRAPRPLLTGQVRSEHLQLIDLGPLIGLNDPAEGLAEELATPPSPPRRAAPKARVLPDLPFRPDLWQYMDVDLAYHAAELLHGRTLLTRGFNAHVSLHDQQLALDPLEFDLGGGRVTAHFSLDGLRDPAHGRADIDVTGISLVDMFGTAGAKPPISGTVHGQLRLTGEGDTLAALLGSGDGSLWLGLGNGKISRYLIELTSLDLLNAALTKAFDNDAIAITCAGAEFSVRRGVASATTVQLQTPIAYIDATGTVDLGTERLNLVLHPHTLEPRLFSLRSPITITGTFRHPHAAVEEAPLLLRAGVAVALAALAPPALALLPLTTLGSKAPPCMVPNAKAATGGNATRH